MSVQSGDYMDDENLLNKVNSRDLVPVGDNNNDVEAKISEIQSMAQQELDREQFILGDNYSKSITSKPDPFVNNTNNNGLNMPSTLNHDSSSNMAANLNTKD